MIARMLRTPLSRPSRRAAWTLLDKVLNKAMDYDARIMHPETFSNIAERLDQLVRDTTVKIVDVSDVGSQVEACVRLSAKHGGGDITSAMVRKLFAHLAASCQYLPAVAGMLSGLGYTKLQIDGALDLSGVQWCMDALAARNVFIRFDGAVVAGVQPSCLLNAEMVPWGQARKLHAACFDALQLQSLASLREQLSHLERDLARLHSCTGDVSSKWLTEFPPSWFSQVPFRHSCILPGLHLHACTGQGSVCVLWQGPGLLW